MESTPDKDHRSGYVAIIGKPNVGKSTLINHFVDYKVSIVSKRPQTTRNRIAGIRSDERSQIIFVDTPGIHRSRQALNQFMMEQVRDALDQIDVLLLLHDVSQKIDADNLEHTEKLIEGLKVPKILVLNKIDRIKKPQLLERMAELSNKGVYDHIIPISALKADGTDTLLNLTIDALPVGPQYFPPDQITDVSERFIVSEIVREKIFRLLSRELPYSAAVNVEEFHDLSEKKGVIRIFACIHVERDSQKAIVIGKGGSMLKKIGQLAREELERLFNTRIYLKLFVRVDKNWTKNPHLINQLGHGRF